MEQIYQAVVKRFMLSVPDHIHLDRTYLRQGAVDGGLVHMDSCLAPVFIYQSLDKGQVFSCNFAVSDD
jgi:hypothetical protein